MKHWLVVGLVALVLTFLLATPIRHSFRMADGDLFAGWRAGKAKHDVNAIEAYLAREGVGEVLPLGDILRSDARWRRCPNAQPFAVPPRSTWPAMVPTLRYIRDEVVPAVGPVRVVSGYRDPVANRCFKGAKASRHLHFAALDLVPQRPLTREDLISALCPLHARNGARFAVGLGIYKITRFHIDTAGYRRWGADYRGSTSPCA
ncbi:Peptidase M15 [Sphingopyxis sp. YR583]|jgi:hypothetical protein|uniref:D-Ala-D-Ala carboxypeptidase family metallohydrolase n=1 Tax=Sphingopyxis sp. YR583 TaxID=1881047 RepID=UPI0008A7BB0E|nr:D-Ala-D-Ala carboxypeptidase family metallohydrolase [Sphingopyxis sp. YR583]SEH17283.1 Peptidase M15 [Sphingopyxis sp. YR583]